MDAIWEAEDARTGERVALKAPRHAPDALGLARFERGARLAASLDHPRVVRVIEHGRADDGFPWLAMELLRGEDLRARLRRAPLAVDAVVDLGVAVCEALAHAHARRVIHRDLSARNVFLVEGGGVKVLDFGIARALDERPLTRTLAEGVIGTLHYMAPEQVRSERDLDPRADLWSVGVVLFEALTGKGPFLSENLCGLAWQILSAATPDPRELRADAPPGLCDVIRRALRKSRDERYASAEAMAAALRALSRDAGGEAARASVELEHWLASAVFLRGVEDPLAVFELASEHRGQASRIGADDVVAVFGGTQWLGDEPLRASRFAWAARTRARAAGVATGRGRAVGTGHAAATGEVVDRAASIADEVAPRIDAATASVVRGQVAVTPLDDGTCRLTAAHVAETGTRPRPHDDTPFVGREVELSMLLDAVERSARDAAVRAVLVLGGAGMGRTRLAWHAQAALVESASDVTVLTARGDPLRRDAPFAALSDAFASAGVADVFRVGGNDLEPQVFVDRARGALEEVLRRLAERAPVLLVLDDAHWIDAPSRDALRWLCEVSPDLALAVWFFAAPEGRASLAEVVPGATVRELGPVTAAEVERIVRAAVPGATDEVVRRVAERAEGVPRFVEELAREVRARGADALDALPTSVEALHQATLHGMDRADREFVKRAAVYGRAAWVEGVEALGGDVDAFARLRRAGLVTARSPSRLAGCREFSFRSGALRDVAYGLPSEHHLRAWHAAAARWLTDRAGVTLVELARHWDLSGDAAQAAAYWTLAAESAARAGDALTVRDHAARVLGATGAPRLRWRCLVARDAALQIDGDRALQREGLEALEALAPSLGTAEMAEAAWRWCYFARVTNDRASALAHGELAIDLALASDAARWGATAHIEMALLHANDGRRGEARAHATRADALAARCDDPWLAARAATTLAYVIGEVGDAAEALGLFERAAEGYARTGDRRREAIALANGGYALLRLGRVAEALGRFEAAITLSRKVGNASTVATSLQNRATVWRMLRRHADARADLDAAEREARRLGRPRLVAAVAIERLYTALDEGTGDLLALADAAESSAAAARSPNLVASAKAVALRARGRAWGDVSAQVAEARALADASRELAEAAAELRVALWEVDEMRRDAATRAEVVAALGRVLAEVGAHDDPAACREGVARRMLVPEGLLGG